MSPSTFRILLVDSDDGGRRLLELGLRKEGYDVVAASDLAGARASQGTFDALVIDPALSDGDGVELVASIAAGQARAPQALFVVSGNDAAETLRLLEAGAAEVLRKPIRVKDLAARLHLLLSSRGEGDGEVIQTGDLASLELFDFLNDVAVEHRTGAIRLVCGQLTGTIFFENGELIDAVSDRVSGEAAVHRLFTFDHGTYEVLFAETTGRTHALGRSSADVIADALAYADEWKQVASALPSLEDVYQVEYRSFVTSAGDLPDGVDAIIRTFDGFRTVREAVSVNETDDLTALRAVPALLTHDILSPVGAGRTERPDDEFERLRRTTTQMRALDVSDEEASARRAAADAERARLDAERAQREAAEAARRSEAEAQAAKAREELEKARRAAEEAAEQAAAAEAEAHRIREEQDRRVREEQERLAAEEAARRAAAEDARRRAEEARLKAEAEARRRVEEEARRRADEERRRAEDELARVTEEMREIEEARQRELAAAEERASEVRREAERLADELRREAQARSEALAKQELELAEKRVALTGRMSAITGDAPASEATRRSDVDDIRAAEQAAIRADRVADDDEPTIARPRPADVERAVQAEKEAMSRDTSSPAAVAAGTVGMVAVADSAIAAATASEPPAEPTTDDEPASEHTLIATPAFDEAAVELGAPAATAQEQAPAASPTPATGLEADFFNTASHDILDDELHADAEHHGPNATVIGVAVAFVVLALLAIVLSNQGGDDDAAPEDETPVAMAGEGETPAVEGSAEGSAEPAGPSAEELAAAERATQLEQTMSSGDFTAYDLVEVAESVAQSMAVALEDAGQPTEVQAAATEAREERAERADRTERPERTERTEREDRSDDDDEEETPRDTDRALRTCIDAYNRANYTDTIAACEDAARAGGGAEAYLYLGRANYELGDSATAVRQLERVVQMDRGDYAGAREAYETYLQYYSDGQHAEEVRRILEQL